jgi:hypothetical protein
MDPEHLVRKVFLRIRFTHFFHRHFIQMTLEFANDIICRQYQQGGVNAVERTSVGKQISHQ